MTADPPPTHYPVLWQNLLSAPLEEDNIKVFLEALNGALVEQYIPSPLIIQTLLYLTLHPPSPALPLNLPTPPSLLHKILSQHRPSSLAHCVPSLSSPKSNNSDTDAPWIDWDARSETKKKIKRCMLRARSEGIWGLLWEVDAGRGDPSSSKGSGTKAKRKRGVVPGADDDEAEGEHREGPKLVSERGWEVADWLVKFWEKDQQEYASEHQGVAHSPLFLQQLPRHGTMQYDNPSLPLAVVGAALFPSVQAAAEADRRRRSTAGRLISLLINTALGPSPPFHPATLTLSLLPLFRHPVPSLTTLTSILQSHLSTEVITHLLAHAIEDLAGIRAQKAQERRKLTSGRDFESDSGNLPSPTVQYAKILLAVRAASTSSHAHSINTSSRGRDIPTDGSGELGTENGDTQTASANQAEREEEDKEARMAFLKLSLMASMIRQKFPQSDPTWKEGGASWKSEVEKSLQSPGVEVYKTGLQAFMRMVDDR